ncbi:unnamed protein product, partial [Discosporangium mesarthrocarpum]
DVIYRRVKGEALAAINRARENRQLPPLSPDDALSSSATAHCRAMCEHNFLSHWDMAGQKPYQRYSEVACGQHVAEEMFGYDLKASTEEEILGKVNEFISEREATDVGNEVATNHIFDPSHTHLGLGIYVKHGRLRYVEVYADRYLEIIEAPTSLLETGANFRILVQMLSEDFGPYACVVYYDPVPATLSVGELQHQFCGPSSDSTASQVGIVWPWNMEIIDDGFFSIPVSLSSLDRGTFYLKVLVAGDPASIPYELEPQEGLELPGASFCGAAKVLHTLPDGLPLGVSVLDGDDECSMLEGCTVEEKHAKMVASTSALRRDLAPIVHIKVVQETGAITLQEEGYEQSLFIPPERSEAMTLHNFGLQFKRLGAEGWIHDENESGKGKDNDESCLGESDKGEGGDKMESSEPAAAPSDGEITNEANDASINDLRDVGDRVDGETATTAEGDSILESSVRGDGVEGSDTAGSGGEENTGQTSKEETLEAQSDPSGLTPALVITDLIITRFGPGEQMDVAEGFELIPDDLAHPMGSHHPQGHGEGGMEDQEARVFLAIKVENGKGEASMAYPALWVPFFVSCQEVNNCYGCNIYTCYKKADASSFIIEQIAEHTAEKTAKQVEAHLGINGGDEDQNAEEQSVEEEYNVDASMTPDQIREWEERRARDAADRAARREQIERENKRREARIALQAQKEEAIKERDELLKENLEWQKMIAALLMSQQKMREEARAEHARGVEKEATPVHENEKHYAETLGAIVAARARLQEQQAEYDKVAIELQTRLDEKEYKAREIADSFRDFKREIAKTAENTRTGKPIPKGVIVQFEATEAKKDEEIEKVRLKNINLRMNLRKLEGNLRAKEQLAEGLHLIDFEQLKIENQTLNEKIEERNEELLKLRKKNTTTVQVLTHTKEKLQFVAAKNAVVHEQLAELDEELNKERDRLTHAKRERDALRSEVVSLKQSQGFANSDLLVMDFEHRKSEMKKLQNKLEDMCVKHDLLVHEQ